MPGLIDLVEIITQDKDDEPEDIFAYAPGLIFTDDLRNLHGSPDSVTVYKSRRFGDIRLKTTDPESENERKLFSHYLWNAGIKMAELISQQGHAVWSMEEETVLELGAGVGLGGIVSTLAGARCTVVTDYPALTILDNIRQNSSANIPANLAPLCNVEGHEWGVLDGDFAIAKKGCFTRVLAADCFWMPHQHANLIATMLHFLAADPSSRVLTTAGFHTGRANLAGFFDEAEKSGLVAEEIYEEDAEGHQRRWSTHCDGGAEDRTERNKWLVVSILKRRTC